jgi:hypothetical protein
MRPEVQAALCTVPAKRTCFPLGSVWWKCPHSSHLHEEQVKEASRSSEYACVVLRAELLVETAPVLCSLVFYICLSLHVYVPEVYTVVPFTLRYARNC